MPKPSQDQFRHVEPFDESRLKDTPELHSFRLLKAPHGTQRTILEIQTQAKVSHTYLVGDRERLARLLRILLQELEGEDRRVLGQLWEIRRLLEGMPISTEVANEVVQTLERGGYVASPQRKR